MDARLTTEQRRMQDTARDYLKDNGGTDLARRVMNGDTDAIARLWTDLGDMDFTALTVPVENGGLGDGMVHLTAVLEAAGRYVMPGPFPETAAAVVPLIAELGAPDQRQSVLEAIAAGDLKTSLALYDDQNTPLPDSIQLSAAETGDGLVVTGTTPLVPYAEVADRLLVATRTRTARDYSGITLCLVDPATKGIDIRPQASLDRTRPLSEVAFSDVHLETTDQLGPLHGGGDALRRAVDRLVVATTAMLVGAADRAVELAVDHGNQREQYGQPVGRFQAVKHRTADMWMDMQLARSLVYYAAWTIDHDHPEASRATAATKTFAADRLHRIFRDGIWNHGGMGFTWDHDGHLYLKQAMAWRNHYGTPEQHRERLLTARLVGND